ncbi:hypothetical protein [Methanoplanus endosymbiosus]|uniref:Uncharacterized protein n=1 Tax=Methanoplanus endosymbiosus TaxID=33865 RepID=A0A9E7TKH2_9EURY|nr:hypothetical protein [Methanoplanus endosymbiosus]UUX92625.1 hypothetical protein L6E24_00415 [Methanoplanus endosymbiosus]
MDLPKCTVFYAHYSTVILKGEMENISYLLVIKGFFRIWNFYGINGVGITETDTYDMRPGSEFRVSPCAACRIFGWRIS